MLIGNESTVKGMARYAQEGRHFPNKGCHPIVDVVCIMYRKECHHDCMFQVVWSLSK